MAFHTGASVHDPFVTRWYSLSKEVGLRLLENDVTVERCIDRFGIDILWTGRNGKRYSHFIHEVERNPGGFIRQVVVDEFKVKVMMSLA